MPGLDLNHANPGHIKVQNITAASQQKFYKYRNGDIMWVQRNVNKKHMIHMMIILCKVHTNY